ncbi:Uma2 family endonuclease [Polyangium aurulentum]|uniref:Uma2 family endonuclease n=1 Tax=Polyangium aurulentum TaxID=2567896 RepID=UPI0010AE55C9|nr:Uma2 family endonuclease [Polyangium aurulentum]UQA58169.1 Uma2 family endonuclease [Polyangium aurulentum]
MVQRLSSRYFVDPEDPRAPSEEQWAQMSAEERAAVVAALPAEVPFELAPSEGDLHTKATIGARLTLDAFFRRIGRKIYVSSNLAVYYPGEARFAPDVIAVREVEPHDRSRWVVAAEGKGLDFVLEVHVSGDRAKDEKRNVERYARLGIEEYFFFDRGRRILRGYRLPEGGARRVYEPIVPQEGSYPSAVLGLDLMLEGDRLRFLYGAAPVPEADELIAKLESALREALAAKDEELGRVDDELRRAQERAEELERALAEALAENERLKRGS